MDISNIIVLILILISFFLIFRLIRSRYIPINPSKNIGGCKGTRFGCCPDNITPCSDMVCSNCEIEKETPMIGAGSQSTKFSPINQRNISSSSLKYIQKLSTDIEETKSGLYELKLEAEKIHMDFTDLGRKAEYLESTLQKFSNMKNELQNEKVELERNLLIANQRQLDGNDENIKRRINELTDQISYLNDKENLFNDTLNRVRGQLESKSRESVTAERKYYKDKSLLERLMDTFTKKSEEFVKEEKEEEKKKEETKAVEEETSIQSECPEGQWKNEGEPQSSCKPFTVCSNGIPPFKEGTKKSDGM